MTLSTKKRVLFAVLFGIISILSISELFAADNKYGPSATPMDLQVYTVPATAPYDSQIITHKYYILNYRESFEQADWTFYILQADLLNRNINRQDDFREDPAVRTSSAYPEDYSRSGYDKGHMVPAADMAYDTQSMSESFFMSNMSPQKGIELNRGPWRLLEEFIRNVGDKYHKVYVYTGPIFDKPIDSYPTIGRDKVAVPEKYYKIILVNTGNKIEGIGFIYPQIGGMFPEKQAVTIAEIQKITGLDFFKELPDDLESTIENEADLSFWKTIPGFDYIKKTK